MRQHLLNILLTEKDVHSEFQLLLIVNCLQTLELNAVLEKKIDCTQKAVGWASFQHLPPLQVSCLDLYLNSFEPQELCNLQICIA